MTGRATLVAAPIPTLAITILKLWKMMGPACTLLSWVYVIVLEALKMHWASVEALVFETKTTTTFATTSTVVSGRCLWRVQWAWCDFEYGCADLDQNVTVWERLAAR